MGRSCWAVCCVMRAIQLVSGRVCYVLQITAERRTCKFQVNFCRTAFGHVRAMNLGTALRPRAAKS